MKIFFRKEDEFIELDEISLLINDIEELKELSSFLKKCVNEIERNDYDHNHFSDFIENKNIQMKNVPELIICKRIGSKNREFRD